jgi:hypothetical protein
MLPRHPQASRCWPLRTASPTPPTCSSSASAPARRGSCCARSRWASCWRRRTPWTASMPCCRWGLGCAASVGALLRREWWQRRPRAGTRLPGDQLASLARACLQALSLTPVPVPKPLLYCGDPQVSEQRLQRPPCSPPLPPASSGQARPASLCASPRPPGRCPQPCAPPCGGPWQTCAAPQRPHLLRRPPVPPPCGAPGHWHRVLCDGVCRGADLPGPQPARADAAAARARVSPPGALQPGRCGCGLVAWRPVGSACLGAGGAGGLDAMRAAG